MSERSAALAYAAIESKDWEGAAEHVEAALRGGFAPALQLRAFVEYKRRNYPAALKTLEETFEAAQGAVGEMGLAMLVRLHLLAGDAQRGWQLLLDCCRSNAFGPPLYPLPRWNGEPLEGRRVVVWGAGYGDDVLFARYVQKLAETGAEVFINCRPRMVRLFGTLQGVREVLPFDREVRSADFQIHFAELPALFGAADGDVWPGKPYLYAEPERINAEAKRVGLVWGTDSRHLEADERSAALAEMAPLASVPGVQLFSLQFGPHVAQLSPAPAGMEIVDLASTHRDFADTASAITAMDLVITIDTAVANLSGALGMPVWVAVPYVPDWRWTQEGERTPWYPSARVFRQPVRGDWRSVFSRMAGDLAEAVSA